MLSSAVFVGAAAVSAFKLETTVCCFGKRVTFLSAELRLFKGRKGGNCRLSVKFTHYFILLLIYYQN